MVAARVQRRRVFDLSHSALIVQLPDARFVIEQAPAVNPQGDRGVVVEGPVASRLIGRFRLFRYEVRCWRDGIIADLADAVGDPIRATDDPASASRVVDLAPAVPRLVWGRDERRTGDMWNSNSVISWLLERAGIGTEGIHPPSGGRAPGWHAGVALARSSAS